MDDVGKRFDKIDATLSELQKLLTSVVRIEEKQANQAEINQRYGTKLDTHDKAIYELQITVLKNSFVSRGVERMAWLVVSLVGGYAVYLLK